MTGNLYELSNVLFYGKVDLTENIMLFLKEFRKLLSRNIHSEVVCKTIQQSHILKEIKQ